MTTNILLIIAVFCMGFAWGSTMASMSYRQQMKSLLDLQHDILVHMQKILNENEKTWNRVAMYAGTTQTAFDVVINENRNVTKGLKILVDAVTEEMNNGKKEAE